MWVAKISLKGEVMKIASKTLKNRINFYVFPISWEYKKSNILLNFSGTIYGEKEDKKKFLDDLENMKEIKNIEKNEDFILGQLIEPLWSKALYNPNIIHIKPALIDNRGFETITIASFDKKFISKFIDSIEKVTEIKVHYIVQKKLRNISIIQENPELTEKQKKAVGLAIEGGYYSYPRKTNVKKLAKSSGLSFSTFQAHLRKAEAKLLPFFFEEHI